MENLKMKDRYKQWVAKMKIEEKEFLYMASSRDIKRLKAVRSFDWVARGDLKRETEALIVATKDQALNALSIEKEAYETDLR